MMAFNGKVVSVYRDKSDHNTKKVKLTTGFIYGLYPEWESKVGFGDSLVKAKHTLKVDVYKTDGQKVILDYTELVKHWKKAWWQ